MKTDYDVIIVGAGFAGMTAAVYCARAGKKSLLIECEGFGGQIAYSPKVENYPAYSDISGAELANNLYEQTEKFGVENRFERVMSIENSGEFKTVVTDEGKYTCKAVIIATGAKHKKLNVPGEDRLTGCGVSYCAVCDGVFYKNKTAAVVGGGSAALSEAIYLSQFCSNVYIIHRRDKFRGEDMLAKRASEIENISFVLDSEISEIIVKDKLTAVIVKNKLTGEPSEIKTDGLFIAVGFEPRNSQFADLVKLDEKGFIVASEDCKTSAEGVFCAGDCRTKSLRQLTTAAADGSVAAVAACEYCDKN